MELSWAESIEKVKLRLTLNLIEILTLEQKYSFNFLTSKATQIVTFYELRPW